MSSWKESNISNLLTSKQKADLLLNKNKKLSSIPSTLLSKNKISPRSSYLDAQNPKQKARTNLLMKLDRNAMENIRQDFISKKLSVDIYDFIDIVQRNLINNNTGSNNNTGNTEYNSSDIEALFEIFQEVDVNGDQTMEWNEFTNYMVDLANANNSGVDAILDFQESNIIDLSEHSHNIDFVKYCHSMDRIIVVERGLFSFKIYDTEFNLIKLGRGHFGEIITALHIPDFNLLVTSSADRTIRFWNTQLTAKQQNEISINEGGTQNTDTATSDVPYMSEIFTWTLSTPQLSLAWSNGVLFSSDSKANVLLFDVPKRQIIGILKGHTDVVMDILPLPTKCVSSSVYKFPDSMIVTASMDGTVRLWDIKTQEELNAWKGHKKPVLSLAYSNQYNLIVSGGMDNFMLVWRVDSSASVFHINNYYEGPNIYITNVRIVDNSPELISVDTKGHFCVFDLRSFRLIQTFCYSVQLDHTVESFTILPASHSVIAAANNKLVRFDKVRALKFDPEVAEIVYKQDREDKRARAKANSRGAISKVLGILNYQINEINRFATEQTELIKLLESMGSSDPLHTDIPKIQGSLGSYFPTWLSYQVKQARLLNLVSESQILLPVIHAEFLDSNLTFFACMGRDLKLWNGLTGVVDRDYLDIMPSFITAACLDGRKRRLFLGDHAGNIHVFALSNGAFMYELKSHASEVSKLVYAAEINTLVTASWDGTVRFFEDSACLESSDRFRLIRNHESDVTHLSYSHHFMLSCSSNGHVFFSDPTSFRSFDSLRFKNTVTAISVLPYSSTLSFFVTATVNGVLSLWKVLPQLVVVLVAVWRNERELQQSNSRKPTTTTAINDENAILGKLNLIGVSKALNKIQCSGQPMQNDPVVAAAMVPIVWKDEGDAANVQSSAVTCFGFNPNTKLLYTGDESGTIKVWPLGSLMQQAAQSHELVKISKKPTKNLPIILHEALATSPIKSTLLLPPINNTTMEAPTNIQKSPYNTQKSPTPSNRSTSTILPEHLRLSSSNLFNTPTSPYKLAGLKGAPTNPSITVKTMNKSASLPAISFKNDGGADEKLIELKLKSQNMNPNNSEIRPITDLGFFEETRKSYNTPIIAINPPDPFQTSQVAVIEEAVLNNKTVDETSFDILTTDRDIMFPNYKIVCSYSFQAHRDSITGLQVIEDAVTPALMSYGFDGSIELWSLDRNKHLASLLTIVNRSTVSKTKEEVLINNHTAWEFYPDIKSHEKYLENSITQVSEVMRERKRKQELLNLKLERSKNMNPLMKVLNNNLEDSNKSKTPVSLLSPLTSPSESLKSPSLGRRRSIVGLMASIGGETEFDFTAKTPSSLPTNGDKKRRSFITSNDLTPSSSNPQISYNPKSPGMFPSSPAPAVSNMSKYRLDSEKASATMSKHLSGINLIDINLIRNSTNTLPTLSPVIVGPSIAGKLLSPSNNFKRSATLAPKSFATATSKAIVFQRPSIVEDEEDELDVEETEEELKIINSALKQFQNGDAVIEAETEKAIIEEEDDEDGMIPNRFLSSYKNNLINNYTSSYFGSGKLDNVVNNSTNSIASNSISIEYSHYSNNSISNAPKPLTSPNNKSLMNKKESFALNKLNNSLNKILEDTVNDEFEGLSFKDAISLITPKPMSSDKVRRNYSFTNNK